MREQNAALQTTNVLVKEQSELIRALQNKPQSLKKGPKKETVPEENGTALDKFIETYTQTMSGVCTELNECKLTV